MSKGSERRKKSSDKKYRENYPKMPEEFVPFWKRREKK